MSRKNKAFLLFMLALVVFTLTGCGKPKGHLQGTLSYDNWAAEETGYVNHAEVTMRGTGLPLRSAFSDVNGQYQISDVLVGKYEVKANYATATNLSDFAYPGSFHWGYYSLNDAEDELCTVNGDYPDLSITIGDVVIADDETATLDFFLYGY